MIPDVRSHLHAIPDARRPRFAWAWLLSAALLVGGFLASSPVRAAGKAAKESCFDCHSDKDMTKDAKGVKQSLFVDGQKFAGSVHATLACRDCHVKLTDKHQEGTETYADVDCSGCHGPEAKIYATSIHGLSQKMGETGAAYCHDCHGNHYMGKVGKTDSPVYKMNLPKTCAKCHANKNINEEYKMKFPSVGAQYNESIHGMALL